MCSWLACVVLVGVVAFAIIGIAMSRQSDQLAAHRDQIAQLVSARARDEGHVSDALAQHRNQIAVLESLQNRQDGRADRLFLDAEIAEHRVTVKQGEAGEADVDHFVFRGHMYRFTNTCVTGTEAWSLSRTDRSIVELPGYAPARGTTHTRIHELVSLFRVVCRQMS
jgi:hypothetical protein